MNSSKNRVTLLSLLLLPMLAGCGDPAGLIAVTGKVMVSGKPAEGATILFHPTVAEGTTASGTVGADGSFSLISAMEPGIAPGDYKVTVIWPDPSKQPTQAEIMMGTAEPGPDLLKGKYSTKASTTLSAKVESDTTSIPDFAL